MEDVSFIKKICKSCNTEYPISYFFKDKGFKDGHKATCRICTKEKRKDYQKEYHEKNKEKLNQYSKEWRQENTCVRSEASKEKIKQHNRDRYRNDEEYREKVKKESKDTKSKIDPKIKNEQQREWHSKNPDKFLFFDFEWTNNKKAIINSIDNKNNNSEKIGARKTKIHEISTEDARDFLDLYHVQGFGRGSIYLGLVYGDRLMAVSSWIVGSYHIELNRMAFSGTVVGGFSKMLNYLFSHECYNGKPILSFVDPRYATGKSYTKVGFKEAGITASPTYWYVNGSGMYHRRYFQKNNLKNIMDFYQDDLTEKQIAKTNGFYRVWGMKQKRFIIEGRSLT